MSNPMSVHKQLEKVRKPRVHITYDVESNGASTAKELPFVVGVMGDFSADSQKEKKIFKERKFVQVDADNFDDVIERIEPAVNFKVDNTLSDDDTELPVSLTFKSMDDFEPANIAAQIEPLKKLLSVRDQLNQLLTKADRSEALEEALGKILADNDLLGQVADELGLNKEEK